MQMTMRGTTVAQSCGIPTPTAAGEFFARYSRQGLCGLEFPSGANHRKSESSAARPTVQVLRWHAAATKALKLTLAGRAPKRLPPLDLSAGTDVQRRVWRALRHIAWGRTWT